MIRFTGSKSIYFQTSKGSSWANPEVGQGANQDVERAGNNPSQQNTILKEKNKLAKLGDAIASHLKLSITDPLTDRGNC